MTQPDTTPPTDGVYDPDLHGHEVAPPAQRGMAQAIGLLVVILILGVMSWF